MPFSARRCPRRPIWGFLVMMSVAALGSGACATTGKAVPRPFPGGPVAPRGPVAATVPTAPAAPDAPFAPALNGRAIADFALELRGVPYRLGGADPAGFDCSGLVQYVFAKYGIALPRVVEQQFSVGDQVEPDDISPGDLIFFNTKRRGQSASHVGIAIAEGQFVHAPNSRGVVRVEALRSTYWSTRFVGARRILQRMTSD